MTREDDRYNAAFMAHEEITDYFQPYAEFYFMDDKTHQQIAPAALFRSANPLDPTCAATTTINCNNPLLSAQQQASCARRRRLLPPTRPNAGCTLTPGRRLSPNCANVEIGRRNIEGGGRFSDFEHENYRGVFGAKGDIRWRSGATTSTVSTTTRRSSIPTINT